MKAAARSPIMMHVACVLPLGGRGITDASATRSPLMPCTRSRRSTWWVKVESARLGAGAHDEPQRWPGCALVGAGAR